VADEEDRAAVIIAENIFDRVGDEPKR